MNYFSDCSTIAEAKKKYHKLAKSLHPDGGGTTEQMVELTRQYDAFMPNKESWEDDNSRYYEGFAYKARSPFEEAFYSGNSNRWNEYLKQKADEEHNRRYSYHGADTNHHCAYYQNRCNVLQLEIEVLKADLKELRENNESIVLLKGRNNDLEKANKDLGKSVMVLRRTNETLSDRNFELNQLNDHLKQQLSKFDDAYKISLWQYIKNRWMRIR
jgi:prefoldin subunit 5